MPVQPSSARPQRSSQRLLIILAVIFFSLVAASAAFAAWTTISLTNNSLDVTWGTATYTETCDQANPQDDLKNAWFLNDGTNIYFRIETCGGPALSDPASVRAVAAIDCNSDGDFTDPYDTGPDGDRLVVYDPDGGEVVMYDGERNLVYQIGADTAWDAWRTTVTHNVNIEWMTPISRLYAACRGSVSPVNIAWTIAKGDGTILDQSESYYAFSNPMDFGDRNQTLPNPPNACATPNNYTGLQCDGARHGIGGPTPGVPLRLGSEAVDPDPGNLVNAASDADDTSGTTPDDEAGIAPVASNTWNDGGGQLTLTIQGATQARLSCWVDFNKNDVWTDSVGGVSEKVLNNQTINNPTPGAAIVRGITLPSAVNLGGFPNSFPARCRIYPTTGTAADVFGAVEFGEVEDHIWEFDANGLYIPPPPPPTPVAVTDLAIARSGVTADIVLSWTHQSANQDYQALYSTTNPYFAPAAGTQLGIVTAPTASITHSGVFGLPVQTFYYNVIGRVSGGSVVSGPSNYVGLFEFGLTPGN